MPQVVDALFSFPGGHNQGVPAIELPKTQVSRAVNATFRGNFLKPRPKFAKMVLSATLPAALFQGGCYYKPDTEAESLMLAIGGRLFQLTPDVSTLTVVERTIVGDANPDTPLHAWLWQAENFVIWNDGQSIPVFFDGTSTRRAIQFLPALYHINMGAPYVPPAMNASNTLTLLEDYTSGNDFPVFFGGDAGYTLTPFAGATVTLKNVADNPGKVIPAGTAITFNPSFAGFVTAFNITSTTVNNPNVPITETIIGVAVLDTNYIGAVGDHLTFGNAPNIYEVLAFNQNQVTLKITNVAIPGAISGVPGGLSYTLPATAIISRPGNPSFYGKPYTLATTNADATGTFTVPAQGSTVSTDTQGGIPQAFTVPFHVYVGTKIYLVTAYNNNVTKQVTVKNVSVAVPKPNYDDGTSITSAKSGNELPPGRMGAYGMGRNWMCLPDGKSFIASDIVGGSSGTKANKFRDAVLQVTENTYLIGGGSFRVPSSGSEIRAMIFTANLDVALGQGPLQVLTSDRAFSCQAPVDRTEWAKITNPILTESLIGFGAEGQNSTILVNGDTMFRSTIGFCSLILARREFATWGNTPQSREVDPTMAADATALLEWSTAVFFDNRVLLSANPQQGSLGVYHDTTVALNTDPLSSLRGKEPSIYDGIWTGLNVMQYFVGKFRGVDRCFAACQNTTTNTIEIWEVLKSADASDEAVTFSAEMPQLDFGEKDPRKRALLRLINGELYIDAINQDANGNTIANPQPLTVMVSFRPDYSSTWNTWYKFTVPISPTYQPRMGLGEPPMDSDAATGRPNREGYAFQLKVEITGVCRFMGGRFLADVIPQPTFAGLLAAAP